MDGSRAMQVERSIGTLRNACERAERAYAATLLSAACADYEPAVQQNAALDSPQQRMFGYGLRHDEAREWDGRSTRTGTITFCDDERIEQYCGHQQWIAYRQTDLNYPGFVIGDRVRIATREGQVHIVAVGANRLADEPPANGGGVRSGMLLLRTVACEHAEIASAAQTTAQRYAATLHEDAAEFTLAFTSGGKLVISASAVTAAGTAVTHVADLVSDSFRAAIRLDVLIATNGATSALEAERALAFCAAVLGARGEAVAIDDTWAIVSAEQLYDLAVHDDTRAALFSLAAAAARSTWPAQTNWSSVRRGVCDEVTVYSSRPWSVDIAAALVGRSLDALSDAMQRTNDPVVPAQGVLTSSDELADAGAVQRLVTLTYDTVELDVAFLDANLAHGTVRARIQERKDIATLLGAEIQHAVVISFGSDSDPQSKELLLEMQRADTLATALAATIARRTDGIAVDAAGAIYSADDLIELALQRRGKAASWTSRVASALEARL